MYLLPTRVWRRACWDGMVPLVQHTPALWHYALTDSCIAQQDYRKALTTGVDVGAGTERQDVPSLCRAQSIIISSSPSYLLPPSTYSLAWTSAYFYFSLHTLFYFYISRLFYFDVLTPDPVLTTTIAPLAAGIDVYVSLAIALSSPGRWMV